MSLSEQVLREMKRLYDGGMTQEEVAAHCHIRHTQAQKILSGSRNASGLELRTFDKMFPNATVNLYGDVSNHADHNKAPAIEGNRGTTSPNPDSISAVIDIIMASDKLTSDEKVKVWNVLRKG